MRYLKHIKTPDSVTRYGRERRSLSLEITYDDLPKDELREALFKNQGGLCAYCMRRIHLDKLKTQDEGYIHIEHIVSQSDLTGEESIDTDNMVGVCSGNRDVEDNEEKHCDASRGNKALKVNPYNQYQMSTIRYDREGRILSTDPEVDEDLNNALNLNGRRIDICNGRKEAYRKLRDTLIQVCPEKDWGRSIMKRARQNFCDPDSEGRLKAYAGVYEYWISRWEKKYSSKK